MLISQYQVIQIETENYLFREKICLKRKKTMQRIICAGHNEHRWKYSRHSPTIWYVYLCVTVNIFHQATEPYNALVWHQSSAQLLRFFVSHTKADSTVCLTLTRRPPLHVWYPTVSRWVPTECSITLVATASYPSLCGRGFSFSRA